MVKIKKKYNTILYLQKKDLIKVRFMLHEFKYTSTNFHQMLE